MTSQESSSILLVSYSNRNFQSQPLQAFPIKPLNNNNSTSSNVIARLAHFPATMDCNTFARWRWIILLTLSHWPAEHRYNEHLDIAWRKWPTCRMCVVRAKTYCVLQLRERKLTLIIVNNSVHLHNLLNTCTGHLLWHFRVFSFWTNCD